MLRRRRTSPKVETPAATSGTALRRGTNRLLKLAVWGIAGTLGAAALAVFNSALQWAPDFVVQLFH